MRIGFLGAGLIGTEHLTGLSDLIDRGLVDACLAGVFDPDRQRGLDARKRFGMERQFDSAEALIDSAEVEVVFVATWTGAHAQLVDRVVAAGKPVFCEKPLARNLAEARAMQTAVDSAQIPNQIGLILRTSPAFGFVRQLCREKAQALGPLMVVNFRDDQYFPIQGRYGSEWRKDHDLAGGGTFIEHSIHDVDIMRWIFGDMTRVQALMGNHAGYEDIEDLAMVTADFAAGGRVHFLSIWHNILSRPSTRHLEIFFENGRIAVDEEVFGPVRIELGQAEERIYEQPDIAQAYLQNNQDLMDLGLSVASPQAVEDYRFLTALQAGQKPEPDFSVGVAAHEVVEAAYRSARQGGSLALPLD